MKNKEKMLFFLGLNVIGTAVAAANNINTNYNRLYNQMTKNLETQKSNEKSYKLIERILNLRNKELKDLYLQNDYIIKPEYLEWQIFFSGFYGETDRKGENNFKPYKSQQEVKEIEMGINIPVNKVNIGDISLDINKIQNPKEVSVFSDIEIPTEVNVELKDIADFNFNNPDVSIPTLFSPPLLDKVSTGFNQYETIGFNNRDNVVIGNSDLKVNGDKATIAITGTGYGMRVADSSFNWYGHNDSSTNSGTVNIGTYSSNVGYFHAFLNALAGSYTVEGNWDFRNETTNAFVNNASNNTVRFVSVNHAYHATNQTTVFKIDPDSIINLYGRSDGHMTVGVEFQFYQALPAKAINEGTINLQSGTNLFGMTAMIERDGSSAGKRPLYESSLENRGKIVINSNESIGIDFAKYRFENQKELTIYVSTGNIEINGEKNYGARVPKIWDEVTNGKNYFKETVIDGAGGVITVNCKENVGISLSKQITGSSTVTAYNGLDVSNSTDIIGNIRNLNIKVNGEKTVGILRNSNFSTLSPETITFNNANLSSLTFGNDAKDSILIRTDKYGVVLEKDLNLDNDNAVNTSENNIILLANDVNSLGSKQTFAENKAELNVGENLKKTTGLMAVNGGYLSNSGNINIKSDESNGLVIMDNSSGYNSADIKMEGDGSLGVYNLGDFTMDSGEITLTGKQSVGFYSSTASGTTNIKDSKIDLHSSGVNLFLTNNASVNLENVNLGVGSGGLLAYTYPNKTTKVSSGHINIIGSSEARIGSDGTAFYLRGNLEDITVFLNSLFTGTGVLNLYMDSPDSRLFILDNPDNPINLSSITDTGVSAYVPAAKVNIIGSGYKPYSILKGKLTIDQNADLDNSLDPYTRLEFFSSKVTVNSDAEIKGNNSSQVGIAQKNYFGTAGRSEIELINNGNVILGGTKSMGIIADYGIIENNGTVKMTGNEAVGLYGSNGSLIKNTGTVYTGNKGIGIYASNNLSGTPALYGNKEIDIINDGMVKVDGIGNGVGIFANNVENEASNITLTSNSKVDVSTGKSNVGVFTKNSTVNAEGEISIGVKSIGMYLDASAANTNNLTMNISGDNAIGYHMVSGSGLSGTGTFNINGKNNVLFNYISLSAPVSYINYGNFSVNASADSSYIGANIENGAFYNNSSHVLTEDSRLVLGKNSVIYLDGSSDISSVGDEVIGVSADGAYSGTMPFVFTGTGALADREVINKGEISVNNQSVALHLKNNAGVLNSGTISVKANSVGIYADRISDIENTGIINIGENSTGIYLKESMPISSVNTGKILSNADYATGIYSEYSGAVPVLIKTEDEITVTGKNSTGIYTSGTGTYNIENTGIITIGDSDDIANPGIAIYSNNSGNDVKNSGTLNIGKNSLGIYNNGGTVDESGILNVSDSGVGIYSNGGIITAVSGQINAGANSAIGIYAKNNAKVLNNSSNMSVGDGGYGFVIESNSELVNNTSADLGNNSIFVYASENNNIVNNGIITSSGENNIALYSVNGGYTENNASLIMNTGRGNIGIFNENGEIRNTAVIKTGDSLIDKDPLTGQIIKENSRYAVGIYSENSKLYNSGNIEIGENAVGIYAKNSIGTVENHGNISAGSSAGYKNGAVGIIAEGGSRLINYGDINLFGDGVIGIYAKGAGHVINEGKISVTGKEAVGIYGMVNTIIENNNEINVSGNGSIGIIAPSGKIINNGIIKISDGAADISEGNKYPLPALINMGIIEVDGRFDNTGMDISIKPDLSTIKESVLANVDFVLQSGSIAADEINLTETVKILPDFSQGTNAKVYKLEDVLLTGSGGVTSSGNKLPVLSKSLTWEATPALNDKGNIDIYMQKIDYRNFTDGFWYESMGTILDEKYYGAIGSAGEIYDKIDLIETEADFRNVMSSMAGEVYANINQREKNILGVFEDALFTLQDSKNNTKENVKINIIAGKGKTTEKTEGVSDYDYTATGILALREVERTYRHTFGYSLGYLHTGFEFKDGNSSEEWVDTIQLGVHNKYKADGWQLRNDITGRASIHNIDRNIDWPNPGKRSEMGGTYETYSITSDNILGKEFEIGKRASVMPYGAFKATYVTRPTFSENGLESLEVDGNDAWSAKPRAGVEVKGTMPLGKNSEWQLKGALDIAYEYELADLNETEKARLTAIEDRYHKLAKPEEEKGTFRTKAAVGIEIEDRYGLFITGEYSLGSDKENDYRAGVNLKAVF